MFFEMRLDQDAPCRNYFSLVRPILQMVYVFVQMYFVFLNQKVNRMLSLFEKIDYQQIILGIRIINVNIINVYLHSIFTDEHLQK